MENTKSFLGKNAMLIILLFVMLMFEILMSIYGKGSLFSPENLANLISQNSYVVILATGMLLCILTGGNIDLAVGSTICLVSAFTGILIVNMKLDPYISILLCLFLSTLIGAYQAFWISYVKIPAFVVTLSGMLVFRGLALVILGAKGIAPFPDRFLNLFNTYIPGLSYGKSFIRSLSIILAIVVCAIFIVIQVYSRIQKVRRGYDVEYLPSMVVRLAIISIVIIFIFDRLGQYRGVPVMLFILGVIVLFYSYFTLNTVPGRYLYAMGGNEKAARLSGINTKKMLFFAYTNLGFLCGIASLVCVARFNQSSTTAGTSYELDAIGACYIGGASAYGGVGTVSGAVIGAVFMGVLNMGMSILGADPNLQRVIKGLVLLVAVVFDVLSKKRRMATA
jgi:putative multiple sugar transport system permease protein